jgi:hypothetical protein
MMIRSTRTLGLEWAMSRTIEIAFLAALAALLTGATAECGPGRNGLGGAGAASSGTYRTTKVARSYRPISKPAAS